MKKRKPSASEAVHKPRNLAIQLRATGGVESSRDLGESRPEQASRACGRLH